MLKETMYSNNPHNEDDMKKSIQDVVSAVSPAEL
jgi:hypothetical protein